MFNRIAYWLLGLLAFQSGLAQTHSYLGGVHTPKGDLHMLMIFVRYENVDLMPRTKRWPNVSEEGVFPEIGEGAVNSIFYPDPDMLSREGQVRNMSDYYYRMSGGKFRLTGDVFPIQVPIEFIPEKRGNFFKRQGEMNQRAINWIAENYPDFDWSKYDRRKNSPNYRYDNSETEPDGILDYVVIMHRAPGSTGMGASSNLGIPGSKLQIKHGHTGIKCYTDPEHNWEYFKHEFAHNLYSAPHYLGANSADGNKFYTQKGWGMMAAWHSPFFTANAWERWWLGWLEPQEIKENGTYFLRDFMTADDAICIPIPGTKDYLWLENHQKKDHWDQKLYYKDPAKGEPQSAPGIYAYVVAEPATDRDRPRLNPFNSRHSNFIKMYNGQGNFDYEPTGDSIRIYPVYEQGADNPIAGQNAYQFIRADFDKSGKILVGMAHGNSDPGGREQFDLWAERKGTESSITFSCTGDENDAFVVGDELSLSGKVPVLNYPIFDRPNQRLQPFVLNGIRITIRSVDEGGTYELDIALDDWEVREDKRWCGNMLLPEVLDSSEAGVLTIKKKRTLRLNLSGTADREVPHPESGTFSNPSRLEIAAGRTLHLKKKAVLIVEEWSELIGAPGSTIILDKKARIVVQKKGKLNLDPACQLILGKGAKILRP